MGRRPALLFRALRRSVPPVSWRHEDTHKNRRKKRSARMARCPHAVCRTRAACSAASAPPTPTPTKNQNRKPNPTRKPPPDERPRSEEHTSELQSLMRISYAVFCLKKKKTNNNTNTIK